MKTTIALLMTIMLWTSTAFSCPMWWETYKPQLVMFGVNSSWAGPIDEKALSIQETLQGWQELTGLDESDDLKTLVYDATLDEITSLRASALDGRTCELARKNAVAATLAVEGRLDIIDYLIFLREAENGVAKPDPWEYRVGERLKPGTPDRAESTSSLIFASAEAALKADLPEALKRRYIYQMFKFGFSADTPEHYEKLKNVFNGEVAAWPDEEPIKQWCRSYYAGVLYHEGDLTGAFKEYAQVYSDSFRCRERAHQSLHLILRDNAEAGLKNLEQADLTVQERKAIQQVLNSFNSDLEATLTATVEKGWPLPPDINQRLTSYLNAENDRRLVNQASYIPEAPGGLEKVLTALAAVHEDSAPWYLAAANLAILRGDAAAARTFLHRADRADHRRLYKTQSIVLRTLNRAYLEPLDLRGEAMLLEHLSWLIKHGARNLRLVTGVADDQPHSSDAARLDAAFDGIFGTILPDRYTRQGRDDRAALVLAASISNTESVKPYASSFPFWKLIQSPPGRLRALADTLETPRTPFEKFLVKTVPWTPDYPLELAGSYYIRTHRFDHAVKVLARIPQERRRPWTEGSSAWNRRGNFPQPVSSAGAYNPFGDALFRSDIGDQGRLARKALFEEARKQGLSAEEQEMLVKLTGEPDDRLEFASQMKRLKELGRQPGEAGAMALFYYAQGLYNTSWHGSSWRMSAWGRLSGEARYYADISSRTYPYYWLDAQIRRYNAIDPDDQYHYPSAARKALSLAMKKTGNPELKARINYMLADMAQTDRQVWRDFQEMSYEQQRLKESTGAEARKSRLRELTFEFGDTSFIRQAGEVCPMLKELL